MLKSAAEMAAAARAAREEADKLARAKCEEEARTATEKREAAARIDRAHRAFEPQALAAARAGHLGLASTAAELSLDRLREQGFVAERLTRRESFEQHLVALVSTKSEQLVLVCDRVVSACPGLARIDGDDFLHRNPLISLLETLWRRGELKEPFDVELLLAFARIQTAAKPADLETVKVQIDQALRMFADLKATEAKYQRVRWENLTIPQGANQATYITWESADDGQGLVSTFSASRLKWLAVTWPELAATVGTSIEEAARGGQSELTLYAWRTAGTWNLSWDWPPDAWMADDDPDGQDPESATDSTWGGDMFCQPKLAAEELILSGYDVTIAPVAIGSASDGSPAETYLAACGGEAYALTIRW
jgi:hypothetical protein